MNIETRNWGWKGGPDVPADKLTEPVVGLLWLSIPAGVRWVPASDTDVIGELHWSSMPSHRVSIASCALDGNTPCSTPAQARALWSDAWNVTHLDGTELRARWSRETRATRAWWKAARSATSQGNADGSGAAAAVLGTAALDVPEHQAWQFEQQLPEMWSRAARTATSALPGRANALLKQLQQHWNRNTTPGFGQVIAIAIAMPPRTSTWLSIAASSNASPPHLLALHDEAASQVAKSFLPVVAAAEHSDKPGVAAAAVQLAAGNVLGSVTRFYGSSLVAPPGTGSSEADEAAHAHAVESEAYELISGMPSRAFFPRGFLWDEGFHQVLTSSLAPELGHRVLTSWLASMNATGVPGWMAREQILGLDSRSRVPYRFQVQRPDIANPPTLLLAVDKLATWQFGCGVHGSGGACLYPARGRAWLAQVYPPLRAWYNWFITTQRGAERAENSAVLSSTVPGAASQAGWIPSDDARTFQWQGASPGHVFACGLDDFPRGLTPTPHDQHVDLVAWLAWAARLLQRVAAVLGEAREANKFLVDSVRLARVLDDQHWQADQSWFCDVGATALAVPVQTQPRAAPAWMRVDLAAALAGDQQAAGYVRGLKLTPEQGAALQEHAEIGSVCRVGYSGLLPFSLGLMTRGDPRVSKLLFTARQQLLSEHGLRSLSKQDPLYRQDEDYWRGRVWVNMNWLAARSAAEYTLPPTAASRAAAWWHVPGALAQMQVPAYCHNVSTLLVQSNHEPCDEVPRAEEPGSALSLIWQQLLDMVGAGSGHERVGSLDPRSLPQWLASVRKFGGEVARGTANTVVSQWASLGSIFEHYDPDAGGHGGGTSPFTGWSGALLPELLQLSARFAGSQQQQSLPSPGATPADDEL